MTNPFLNYISLPEAQPILRPRMLGFVGALKNAVNAWNTTFGPAQMVLGQTSRACILHDYWYYLSYVSHENDPGVVRGKDQNQLFFVIEERLIIRFKLIDRYFNSSNFPTPHATEWRLQTHLAGLPQCERLEFAYRLDITGTVIKDAFVLLRVDNKIVWLWQIAGARTDTFPLNFPLTPIGQSTPIIFAYDDYLL